MKPPKEMTKKFADRFLCNLEDTCLDALAGYYGTLLLQRTQVSKLKNALHAMAMDRMRTQRRIEKLEAALADAKANQRKVIVLDAQMPSMRS